MGLCRFVQLKRDCNLPADQSAHGTTATKGMAMRVWKLSPTGATEDRWKQWNQTPILVRASDETEGRKLAAAWADQHATAQTNAKYAKRYVNPWGPNQERDAPWPTKIEDVTDQCVAYSGDGPPGVLPLPPMTGHTER